MRGIILSLLIIIPLVTFGQDTERIIRKGLFAGKGTLAIGKPSAYEGTNMYISGNLQYYLEDNISFRGETWLFLGTDAEEEVFKQNSTLFTNFNYHFSTKNNLDPYIGIGPGVSWTQLREPDNMEQINSISSYSGSASPVASITTGINYYAKWVHLFIEAKYMQGIHLSDLPAVSLNEIRIAFGFGFNINTIKKK